MLWVVLVGSVLWWSGLGCTSSADGPAEIASAAEIACEDSQPQLAPHLRLARPVDYVADQAFGQILSSVGEPCSHALDRVKCEAAVQMPYPGGRQLLTTEGDDVRVSLGMGALDMLGEIDTNAEALWLAAATGRLVTCTSSAEQTEDGFRLTGVSSSGLCPNREPVPVELEIRSSGLIVERPPLEDEPCPPTP
jgi:hypothetical protein